MEGLLIIIVFVSAWLLLQLVILPRMDSTPDFAEHATSSLDAK